MAYRDPYENYMASLGRGATPPSTAYYPQAGMDAAPASGMGPMGAAGAGVKAGSDALSSAASLYATYKALEAAKEERNHQRQREQQADYLASQDRIERRRQTGRNEMFENANYSGDFMDNLMNMYRNYNGGFFNLHGA